MNPLTFNSAKMKRKLMTIIAAVVLLTVAAQAQISFGVRAGAGLQNINGKDADGDKLENKMIPGFNIGVNVEIPVADEFYVQPGLLFATKGAKEEYEVIGIDVTAKKSLSYLEIPINFLYKPQLGNGKLICGFGPYLAYGVAGKVHKEWELLGVDMSETPEVKYQGKVDSDDPNDVVYVKGFDAGANLLFGYELSFGLSIQLNAQLGLLNMNPSYEGVDDDDSRDANTGYGLSLGYRF